MVVGTLSGDLIVAPLILTWARSARSQRFGRPRLVEFVVLALAVVVVVVGVFTNWLPGSRMPHYLFPMLIWSALRFGPRGAATTNAVITAFAVVSMMYQRGPFGELADFQSFVSISAVATLALGAMRVEVIRAFRRKAAIQYAALDAIVTVDSRDRIVEFNPAAERLFGVSEVAALGRDVKQMFMPASERARHPGSIARYLNEHSDSIVGRRVRYTAKRSDGHEFPAEIAVTRMPVDEEKLYTGFVRDISAEVQAEASRRESRRMLQQKVEERTAELRRGEELMRDAQMLAHLGSFDLELSSGALDWSEEMFRIYGQDPKSFVPTYPAFLGAVHPDDRPEVTTALEAAISTGTPFSLEERIVRPDGSVRVLQSQGRVLHGGDGRGSHIMGCCQDITERKQAEVERSRLVDLVESVGRRDHAPVARWDDRDLERGGREDVRLHRCRGRRSARRHPRAGGPRRVARPAAGGHRLARADSDVRARPQAPRWIEVRSVGDDVEHRGSPRPRDRCVEGAARHDRAEAAARSDCRFPARERGSTPRDPSPREEQPPGDLSLLNLQVASVPNETARKGLVESQTRIQSMALLHQLLYQSKDLARIELGDYLQALVNYLVATYNAKDRKIGATVNAPTVQLDLDQAIPCGLIVNELVTNSLRHAFTGRTSGRIVVDVAEVANRRLGSTCATTASASHRPSRSRRCRASGSRSRAPWRSSSRERSRSCGRRAR